LLGPADDNRVLLSTGSSSRGHSNGRWQESQHDSARALPILSRADRGTAFAHHEARSPSTSAEPERRRLVLESPSAALSWSPQPDPSAHRVFRSPQIDDNRFRVPGNVARQHDRPLSVSPLADVRPDDIRSNSSNGFSFNPATPLVVNRPLYVEPSHASGSQGPIVNPVASPRAHVHGTSNRKGKRRASVQNPDAYIDSFDWSEIRRSVPSPQSGMMEMGDSLGPPGLLLRSSSPCSHISVASSNETLSVFSFEVNISTVEIPGSAGRSAHVASPPPTPQPTVSPFAVSSLVEQAIPDLSTQGQEGLNGEDNGDNSQDLQVSSGDAKFGNLGDVDVVDPASVEHTDSSRADLSVLFDDSLSPTLTRLQSPSKVASTSRASTHLPTQSIRPSGLDSTSPSRVWPLWSPSLPPYVDQEASRSTEATGLGLSIEGMMSPHSHPRGLQHQMTTLAPLRTPPHRHAGRIDRQSTTGDDTFPRDAPAPAPHAQESPSYLRSAMANLMQQQSKPLSGGTRSTNGAAPFNSPPNIPLPSSPTTSSPSGSPARLRLQAQPSHRSSPHMPFYPSLTVDREDGQQQQQQHTLLSPSGLDVPLGFASGFGRPTPHPSPIQAPPLAPPPPPPPPATPVIRTPSPSADPRSPISRLTRIRGSIMGLSRLERVSFFLGLELPLLMQFFFHIGASCLVVPLARLLPKERLGCGNNSMNFCLEGETIQKLDSRGAKID
jgi:hypothetical protein